MRASSAQTGKKLEYTHGKPSRRRTGFRSEPGLWPEFFPTVPSDPQRVLPRYPFRVLKRQIFWNRLLEIHQRTVEKLCLKRLSSLQEWEK